MSSAMVSCNLAYIEIPNPVQYYDRVKPAAKYSSDRVRAKFDVLVVHSSEHHL